MIDISDAIALLRILFHGEPEPGCMEAADVEDNSRIDVTDPILILVYLFEGGAPPVHPGPDDPCGLDVDSDDLGCISYPAC